jgi:hypothetical protein
MYEVTKICPCKIEVHDRLKCGNEITDYDNRSMAKYQTEVILGRYMTAILQEINQLIFILKAGKKRLSS